MKLEFAIFVLLVGAIPLTALQSYDPSLLTAAMAGYPCWMICNLTWDPVCSIEDITFINECWLICHRAIKACNGPCPCNPLRPSPDSIYQDCHCSPDKDYVCTLDNETYDNECKARCDGKTKACDGKCPCL